MKLIHSIEDLLEENFGRAAATSFQYEIGKDGGRDYMHIAEKAGYSLRNLPDLEKLAERMGTLSGWGRLEVREVNFNKRWARIRWTNGVSVRNKKGKTSVCHFGRGILTGCLEVVFGKRCDSLEVACEGKGDNYCEAVFGEPSDIASMADTHRRVANQT